MFNNKEILEMLHRTNLKNNSGYSDETYNNLANALANYKEYNTFPLDEFTINPEGIIDPKFKQWFVGFTDAEGSFSFYLRDNGKRVVFSLVIKLHEDDKLVLEVITKNLGINNTIHSNKDKTVTLNIADKETLLNKIIPIFDEYPLITKKSYDYALWRKAIMLYYQEKSIETMEIIKVLKTKLNKYENNPDVYITHYKNIANSINLCWLIGFIEGEGSFCIKTQKDATHFILTQHKESTATIQGIHTFPSA